LRNPVLAVIVLFSVFMVFFSAPVIISGYIVAEQSLTLLYADMAHRIAYNLGASVTRDGATITLSNGDQAIVLISCIELTITAVSAAAILLLFYAVLSIRGTYLTLKQFLLVFPIIFLSTAFMNMVRMGVQLYIADVHPAILATMGWAELEATLIIATTIFLAAIWATIATAIS